ncbi:hypothetical protein ASF12_29050 [Paenibacillus sp. Leaf72]|nr:hypothetical protein ASF12_29050 [Paenibacillus sp. Leaf72]
MIDLSPEDTSNTLKKERFDIALFTMVFREHGVGNKNTQVPNGIRVFLFICMTPYFTMTKSSIIRNDDDVQSYYLKVML